MCQKQQTISTMMGLFKSPFSEAHMPSLLEITEALKNKIANPRNFLLNRTQLDSKMTFFKGNIISVVKMSKYVYILYSPHPIYVSTVFNSSFSFIESNFESVVAKRCLDSIYYDLEVQASKDG